MAYRDESRRDLDAGEVDCISGDDRFSRGGSYGYRTGTHDDDYRGAGEYGGSFTAGGFAGAGFGGGFYGYGPESGYGLPGVDPVGNQSQGGGAQGGFTTGVDQMVFRSPIDVGGTSAPPRADDRAERERGDFAGVGPRGYSRSRERILDDVCDRMMRHPELDASGIEVDVTNGVVVLTGTVTDRRSKRLADDIAGDVWGVIDVDNRLTIARE